MWSSTAGRIATQFPLVVRRDRRGIQLSHGIHQEVNQMPLRQPVPQRWRRRWRRRQQPRLIRTPSPISLLAHNQKSSRSQPTSLQNTDTDTRSSDPQNRAAATATSAVDYQDRLLSLQSQCIEWLSDAKRSPDQGVRTTLQLLSETSSLTLGLANSLRHNRPVEVMGKQACKATGNKWFTRRHQPEV